MKFDQVVACALILKEVCIDGQSLPINFVGIFFTTFASILLKFSLKNYAARIHSRLTFFTSPLYTNTDARRGEIFLKNFSHIFGIYGMLELVVAGRREGGD